jgi:hypothetical protein
VREYGSQENAYQAIKQAAANLFEIEGKQLVNAQGVFEEVIVQVGTQVLRVSGRIIDDVVYVGDAYIE